MKNLMMVLLSCCLVVTLASCSSKPIADDEQRQIVEGIDRIAVLPVQIPVGEGKDRPTVEEEQLHAGARHAYSILQQELGGNEKIRMVSPSMLDNLKTGVQGGFGGTIAGIGEQLDCDAVLLVTMKRFTQRQGGEMAVDAPASASFSMNLYETKTRSIIWVADFNETQESLLENIFSFGKARSRGFKWITVEDLVEQGMKERLAELPYL